ncbi:hypothetical protein ACRAKI_22490 [Saccharothrix isguenensis]
MTEMAMLVSAVFSGFSALSIEDVEGASGVIAVRGTTTHHRRGRWLPHESTANGLAERFAGHVGHDHAVTQVLGIDYRSGRVYVLTMEPSGGGRFKIRTIVQRA